MQFSITREESLILLIVGKNLLQSLVGFRVFAGFHKDKVPVQVVVVKVALEFWVNGGL